MDEKQMRDCDEDEFCHNLRMFYSVARSLWRNVKPHLRGVTLGHDASQISVHCIFDGAIQEEDLEMMDDASGEVFTDFLQYDVEFSCIRWDYPKNLNEKVLDVWVFRRYEEQ